MKGKYRRERRLKEKLQQMYWTDIKEDSGAKYKNTMLQKEDTNVRDNRQNKAYYHMLNVNLT
jgi:hypothetical protein